MPTFVLLTRIAPELVTDPHASIVLSDEVTNRLEETCPGIRWIANYAVLGPYDYLDVFEAPDQEAAMRLALVVRSVAKATTEVWGAQAWDSFKTTIQQVADSFASVSSADEVTEASMESFPASDPPSWTGSSATTV